MTVTDTRSRALVQAPLLPPAPGEGPLDLREVDLREGRFAGADLDDADLRHARLDLADLRGAHLRGARLSGADLTLAQMQGVDLRGADLSGADLSGADLAEADLSGADLSDTELSWVRLSGTRGLPDGLKARARTAQGRVKGVTTGQDGEPAAGVAAWQRGRRAHGEGMLGEAERHYRAALAWVPDSDAARYGLGCVALERRDPAAAARWWRDALAVHAGADRARFDLAVLQLLQGETGDACALMTPCLQRQGPVGATAKAFAEGARRGQPEAAVEAVAALVPDSPAVRWYRRQTAADRGPSVPPEDRPDTIDRLSDEAWVADERADLEGLLREGSDAAWVWHGAIARAITIGAMDLAAMAEQRLSRVAPEHRLWGIELKHLHVTAQAFEALVRTRRERLGAVLSVRWVALGAHGPTARLRCEGGDFYAKRYLGATRPTASVAYTHRMCRTLAEVGLRVPLPVSDREGDEVMVFGDDLLALYPDLGGRSIPDQDLPAALAAEVGQVLARVHDAGDAQGLRSERPPGGIRVGTRVLRHSFPAAAWQLHMARDVDCSRRYDAWPTRTRLDSLLRATGRRLAGVIGRCRMAMVHGDFGPGNVLRSPAGGQYAVIDWDLCDVDLAVWDLARAIDRVAIHWPGRWGQPAEIRADVARAMLRGYEQVRPLNDHERAALPLLAAASRVDLDATVLPICMPIEAEAAEPVLAAMAVRLSRAAAGAPEIALALEGA